MIGLDWTTVQKINSTLFTIPCTSVGPGAGPEVVSFSHNSNAIKQTAIVGSLVLQIIVKHGALLLLR